MSAQGSTNANSTSVSGLKMNVIDARQEGSLKQFAELRDKLSPDGNVVSEAGKARTIALFGESLTPSQVVERICKDVKTRGMAALLEYNSKLDKKELSASELRVPLEELEAAYKAVDPAFLKTIRCIADQVREFQSAILSTDVNISRQKGGGTIQLGLRYLPMKRIGICVPGGAAAYPSTLLMTAVPAQVAGVKEIVVVAPPTPFGSYNQQLLAACHEIGVSEVYRMGGAQAVAAMAYGVEGIAPVDKIVGPGNLFVALAKRFVFGQVDIDSIAGPSEVIVLADETANPDYVASDLISQAEHDPGSAVLITWHELLVAEVIKSLEKQLAQLSRGDQATRCLNEYGAFIIAKDEDHAAQLTDDLATEHLHISTKDPETMLAKVQNAGAIFMGHDTPVALGDYVAGPSHVLPTGGTARFANGLCANDFLKRSSIIGYDKRALAADRDDVATMANTEGLTAHLASVDVRLGK